MLVFQKTYEPPPGISHQRVPRRIATYNVKAFQYLPQFSYFELTKKYYF
jgi:hypothetical protein